ncbi:MAG: AAA family ATPase, partial [Candidatus Thorarchaeota archaeon]
MSNKFRLKSLSVEGFRGVNQKITLMLNGKSTIVCGPNGVGKSSLLQAIEWGLFGWLPHISGGEFEQEDAIVNQFHSNELAMVELILENPQTELKIVRTREKSRWSRRKSLLTLELKDATYDGTEAEEKTRELIGLTEDEFYASTYLHQEALRDFITGDINTRNEVIDKMLGTYSLTEITKGLPTTKLQRTTRDLRERIQSLKASELSRLPAARSKLKDYKRELDSQKISEDELQIKRLHSHLHDLRTHMDDLADEVDVVITYEEPSKEDLAAIQKTIASLRKDLSEIEAKRFQRYDNIVNRVTALKSSKNQVNDLRERLKNLQATHSTSIKEKIKDATERIATYQSQQRELRQQSDFFRNKSIEFNKYANDLKSLVEREEKITSEHGELNGIRKRLVQFESETKSLDDQVSTMEAYSQLVNKAAEYLKKQKPNICPVCKNQIVPLNIAENLRQEISRTETGAKILELTQTLNQRSAETRELQRVQVQLEDLTKAIDEARNHLLRCKGDITNHTKLSEVDSEAIENHMTQLNSKLDQLTSSLDKLAQEKLNLENVHSEQERLEESLSDLNREIRSELMIENDAELLEAISEALRDAERKLDKFRKLS